MDTLSVNDDLCQRDLAKIILKDRANTGKLLDSLEVKGFIERELAVKNNRPVKIIKITEAGKKMYNETYEKLENVLLAFENTEFSSHITNGDVECGHFFIEVDHIQFKITLGKQPIKSWKDYRKYKKENNTFYYLKTMGTLNSKSKIIARYETLEDFISEFPTISSLYVKQGKTENRIDKLMEDF